FYELHYRTKNNLLPNEYGNDAITIPAREIIHDRLNCFHHQLIGVPPLAAAYWPTVKNMQILRSAADFFENHAQPGGILSGPAGMSDGDATALKDYWNKEFSGKNAGRIAVIGADVKDRKSTRLNSSHVSRSYAVFCLQKKKRYINRASSLSYYVQRGLLNDAGFNSHISHVVIENETSCGRGGIVLYLKNAKQQRSEGY